jgi:hypothetical protein
MIFEVEELLVGRKGGGPDFLKNYGRKERFFNEIAFFLFGKSRPPCRYMLN